MNAKEHYSYRIYSDPQIARSFDSDRFGGPIGQFIQHRQEQLVFNTLGMVRNCKVIDVGAGTGRLTIPFLKRGAEVTACDASREMLEVLRQKTDNAALHIVVADAHQLEFPDQSFDCAVSLRMLLHVQDWKKALSELCRVSGDWLIFDLPPRRGFLLFAPLVHKLKGLISSNYQPYRTFSKTEVKAELEANGFRPVFLDHGFFLPLILHRTLHSVGFTSRVERFFAKAGLTKITGSPITFFARRNR